MLRCGDQLRGVAGVVEGRRDVDCGGDIGHGGGGEAVVAVDCEGRDGGGALVCHWACECNW